MSSLFAPSSPPTPPNPYTTASAQTGANVATSIANSAINNVNQVTPQGSLTYNINDNVLFEDPVSGVVYNVPHYTATQTRSPAEEAIAQQNDAARRNLAGLANSQSGRLGSILGTNIDLSQAPSQGDISRISNVPNLQTTFADAGPITRSYGPADNFSADRLRVEDALYGRVSPRLQHQQDQLNQRLADQGIRYGSPARNYAQNEYGQQVNDALLAITAAGGQEQERMNNMARAQAQFQNEAQQQGFTQNLSRGSFANMSLQQQLQQARAVYDAQTANRNNWLNEQYALRNQPIDEITALLSGSQVSRPQFTNTPQTTIPTTDYAGLINQNFAQRANLYNTESAERGQIIGGLFGLGGNLIRGGK